MADLDDLKALLPRNIDTLVADGGEVLTIEGLAEAVEEAIDVRIRDLPLTPERIWTALVNRKERA